MEVRDAQTPRSRHNVSFAAAIGVGVLLIALTLIVPADLIAHIPIPQKVIAWLRLYLRLIGTFLIIVGLWSRYVHRAGSGERIDRWLELNHRAERILGVLLLLYVAFYTGFTIHRHNIFNSAMLDLGIQDQVVWNTSQGRFFEESIEGNNYLGDHFQPLMALLAVPYRVYPSVYWLLIFQTVCLGLGSIPVFRLARREFQSPLAGLVFASAYLLYPAVGYVNRFDFHFEVVVVPLLLAAWDALAGSNLKLASLWLALALFGKEEIGLTVAVMGVAAVIIMKRVRFGLAWFATGLAFSLVALFVLIPMFRGGPSDTLLRYGWLGKNPVEMVQTIVGNPIYVLQGIQRLGWFYMLGQLFGPVAFSTFLSPATLILVVPGLTYNLLSGFEPQHTAYYQYVAPIIPGVFIGAIYGISRLTQGATKRLHRYQPSWSVGDYRLFALAFLMTSAVFAFIVDSPILDRGVVPDAWKRQRNEAAITEALTLIPEDARVFTTNQYGSHLSHRRDLKVYCCGPGGETGLLETDLALLNLQDFRIGTPERDRVMLDLALQQGFGLVYERDGVVILQRGRGDPGAIPGLIEKWLP